MTVYYYENEDIKLHPSEKEKTVHVPDFSQQGFF